MCIKSDFEAIILKLATYGQREKPFCYHKIFVPIRLSAPTWGYVHVKKTHKNAKKSDFKEIVLKLATNGQNDKEFLLTSKFCPQGVVCPYPGAIYM